MASLKDQMLKAGLISPQQARQATHVERAEGTKLSKEERERRARERQEEQRRQQTRQREEDQRRAQEARSSEEQRSHELQARQQRQARIETALREGRLQQWAGNRAYYFVQGTRVEFIQINEDAARRLEQGHAAIVRSADARAPYLLLQASAALQLREVAPELVVVLHEQRPGP